jgi:hypothetical protein
MPYNISSCKPSRHTMQVSGKWIEGEWEEDMALAVMLGHVVVGRRGMGES